MKLHSMVEKDRTAKIRVIGIGGGGGNAVNNMVVSKLKGVSFIAANTDLQVLEKNLAPIKVQLGKQLTKGLGAGADPDIGKKATLEDAEEIKRVLDGSDIVFITAGLGGGTGTGGASVVAGIGKRLGALTVAVVTKPFHFEGRKRLQQAEDGIKELNSVVDTLITIPNDRLLSLTARNITFLQMLRMADEVCLHAVRAISDLIMVPGHINVDFADVRTVMLQMGMAFMGTGVASGRNRALEAARKAIYSPLLEDLSIDGARALLINITGSGQMTLDEVGEASTLIQQCVHPDANIIWGSVIDDSVGDKIWITVIATGIEGKREKIRHLKLKYARLPRIHDLNTPAYIRRSDATETSEISTHISSKNVPLDENSLEIRTLVGDGGN
jgi:cell division protein FtsZ